MGNEQKMNSEIEAPAVDTKADDHSARSLDMGVFGKSC